MGTIPFHIQKIEKLYPILEGDPHNFANGIIENWNGIVSSNFEFPRPGAFVVINTTMYLNFKTHRFNEMWVHLGSGYFKQIVKTQID
jgi:hypothetical protein